MKTVAPKTAAAIRDAVNADPRFARTIQFNAGGLPARVLSLEPERYDDRAFFAPP